MIKLLVITSVMLLTSCATKVHGLRKTADFTYTNVRSGRLTIGGIAHSSEKWNYKKKISLANQFRTEVQEERKDIYVDSTAYLVKRIGRGLYRELLREIEEDATLSESTLTILNQNLTDRRYIAFARIESDITSKRRNTEDVKDTEGKATGDKKLTTTTYRNMDINFFVYDIRNKYLAWNGMIKQHDQNSLDYHIRKKNGLDHFFELISGSNSQSLDKKYPYPTAPSEKYILSNAFSGFAQNLPEKD